jgi:ankyrin repeat protein
LIRSRRRRQQSGAASSSRSRGNRDIGPFAAWIERALRKFPLNDDIAGLWFYVPEIELNHPFTYFVGSRSFAVNEGEWAGDDAWNLSELADKANVKRFATEFVPTVLLEVQRILNVGPGDVVEMDREEAPFEVCSGVTLTYMGLLVRHAVEQVDRKRLVGGREFRGVGFGYASGDVEELGVVTAGGWQAASRAYAVEYKEPPKKVSANPKLDMNSESFSLRAYVKAGMDVHARDEDGNTTLMHAAGSRAFADPDYATVRQLIEAGVDVKTPGGSEATPLLLLCSGPTDIVQSLLKRGADPNAKNCIDHSPMHSAVGTQCKLANVELMLKHGGDANLKGMGERRPLHVIAEDGDPTYTRCVPSEKRIKLLLEHGAKIDALDCEGNSPLLHAVGRYAAYAGQESDARSQFVKVIVSLLKHGANPNLTYKIAPDPRIPAGGTPLMCRRYDDGEVHLALLKHGADPKLKCKKGKTALDYARLGLSKAKAKERKGIQVVIAAMEASMGVGAATAKPGAKKGVSAKKAMRKPAIKQAACPWHR